MKRTALLGCLLAIAAVVPACGQGKAAAPPRPPATATAAAPAPPPPPAVVVTKGPVTATTLTYGRFGAVTVYRN
ncbi:MAG TPA: hypothetical protein VGE98_02480, partial [Thermoanaerobaculia bacterium]